MRRIVFTINWFLRSAVFLNKRVDYFVEWLFEKPRVGLSWICWLVTVIAGVGLTILFNSEIPFWMAGLLLALIFSYQLYCVWHNLWVKPQMSQRIGMWWQRKLEKHGVKNGKIKA